MKLQWPRWGRKMWTALLVVLLTMTVTSQLALSQNGLAAPRANGDGDFIARTSHPFWTVVDPDPECLSCRWSPDNPTDWYSPSAELPNSNIGQWPVVRKFAYGTVLTANTTPAGFATMSDSRGLPWLKVRVGNNEEICMVRANSTYILPLHLE